MHVWCGSGIIAWGNKRLTMPTQCRFASVAIDIAALSLPLWLSQCMCAGVWLCWFWLNCCCFLSLCVCVLPFLTTTLIRFVRFIWNRSTPFTVSIQNPHYNRFIECSIKLHDLCGRTNKRVLEILHAARRQTILWYLYVFIRLANAVHHQKNLVVADATVAMSSVTGLNNCMDCVCVCACGRIWRGVVWKIGKTEKREKMNNWKK